MQRISWYRALVIALLSTSIAAQAQAPKASAPQASVRELATIEENVIGFVRLPGGRTLIYTTLPAAVDKTRVEDSTTFAYDVATRRSTLLGTNMLAAAVSPLGSRLAFSRSSEDGTGLFTWTMPIDPQTGIATGPAQRVSLRSTDRQFLGAAFSPDGKTLAFDAGPRLGGMRDVTLVPATGGAERVVASYPMRRVALAWSADGKSLYVQTGLDSAKMAIDRVDVLSGRIEALVPRTMGTGAGLSPDGRVAISDRDPDRFFYRTDSGIEGEISVALPPLDSGYGYDMGLDARLRYTWVTRVHNQVVRLLDLTTGQARELLPGNVQTSTPAWSPDGRRLAVLSGNRSHYDITVVSADGSSPRRYPMPMHLEGWEGPGVWEMPWSPDGRFLAFRTKAESKDRQKVGWGADDRNQIAVLDVDSGRTRVLSTASAPIAYGRFVWRSDGKAIRVMKRADAPSGSAPSRYSVAEIPLDGPERQVRDISAEFPTATPPFLFSSDRAVIVTVTADRKTERFFVPIDGGAARRLPDPGGEPEFRVGGPGLAAGTQLFLGLVDAKGENRGVTILSTVGDPTRTLRVPFHGQNRVFHPDGKQVIAVGKAAGDSVSKIFLVPFDGSPTRVVGEIPRGTGGLLAPSPDGKLLAFTSDGIPTSKIHEIDFSPALEAILKR